MRFARITALAAVCALTLGIAGCSSTPDEQQFADYQSLMLSIGKMRGDRRPVDAPYDAATLAENFRRIAFFQTPDDRTRQAKRLTKWDGPIRFALYGTDLTRKDALTVGDLMNRVSRLTDLAVYPDARTPNFMIFILSPGDQIDNLPSTIEGSVASDLDQLARYAWDCSVHAYTAGPNDSEITTAVVYIRAAVKDFYRQACLHEEIFQGLGLFADDVTVRPSIFNDDEEFALLTEHDEHLVRILYDPRLRPGMTAQQAMPMASSIARGLRPGL
ncbi:MAG: DUF2927 domain-containing protein [Pseudomonadota bacterium]